MKKALFLGFTIFTFSCNNETKSVQTADTLTTDLSKIKQMDWVLGNWENLSKDGNLYERWTKTDDSTYSGKSFMIVNKDTVFSESISLELRNNELFYIPVTGQNEGEPVPFKFDADKGGEITFGNPEHDFPQRIVYKNAGTDSLYARVEGNEDGKFRKEEFRMTRSK